MDFEDIIARYLITFSKHQWCFEFEFCFLILVFLQVYVPHYYARCVNDYCMAIHEAKETNDQDVSIEEEKKAVLCQTFSAYSQTCTVRKIVFSWRTANLCRMFAIYSSVKLCVEIFF